ncbi:MAG: C4-dicarboxylate ABC transporter substrate-binding protein, partial [Pseudomonadota bacterium]
MSKTAFVTATAIAMVWSGAAMAEKWDMPMAYSASNFHSEVGAEFAACVTEGTGGELEIVTHPSGSLFPGAQIKRAVQTGQAQIGERLLSGHQNENALFGWDSVPFLVTGFDAHEKLWDVAEPTITELLA